MGRAFVLGFVLALAVLLVTPGLSRGAEGSKYQPAVKTRLGVVATESPAASRVGRSVLEHGGNAADAAVATVFAVGVARPQSCGIGGGGFAVYRGADGTTGSLDFRETAPAAFTDQTLVPAGLHKDFTGHLTVGVPGTVRGLEQLLRRYGTWEWKDAITPAARLAREGIYVPPSFTKATDGELTDPKTPGLETTADRLRLYPATAAQYLKDGRAYQPGEKLVQPDLARTLSTIAREGPDAFYEGEIARQIVAEMGRAANTPGDSALMELSDLAAYKARWRRPLVGTYRGRGIVTVPPPSSGGTTMLEILNILSGYDLVQGSADTLHLMAEAQKLAWADRNAFVADPSFADVPTDALISPAYAATRRALIDPAKAQNFKAGDPRGTAAAAPKDGASPADRNAQGTTTHVSAVDADGNAVAITCTIEQEFGSAVVVSGAGFLLNNELTDFGDPGTANEPGPRKRPRSSIAPTIVVRGGRPELVVGGAGGARIIMGVTQAVINTVDFGMDPARAIDAERMDDQTGRELILEETRLAPGVLDDLVGRGHKVTRKGEYDARPRVQAIGVSPSGLRRGASDSRTDWAALVQRR